MNSLPHVERIVTKESFNYVMGLRSRILIVVPALFYIASSHARYPAMTTPRTTIRYWPFLQPGESPSSQQPWWTNALPSIVSRVWLLTASFFLELPCFVWTEERTEIGSVRSASDWSIVLWASSSFRHLAASSPSNCFGCSLPAFTPGCLLLAAPCQVLFLALVSCSFNPVDFFFSAESWETTIW